MGRPKQGKVSDNQLDWIIVVRLEREISEVFPDNPGAWKKVAVSTASITWNDWLNRSARSTSLIRKFAKTANKIVSIAKEGSLDIELVTRNAIALADATSLPLARCVVTHMLETGLVSGTAKEWLVQFPKPTPLEAFLVDFIRGRFKPSPRVFAEQLEFASGRAEWQCIENLILSLGTIPDRATILFANLLKQRLLRTAKPETLFAVLRKLVSSKNLTNDLAFEQFLEIPNTWQKLILSEPELASLFLSSAMQIKFAQDPYFHPDTPASLFEAKIRRQFAGQLRSGNLISDTVQIVVTTDGILERLDEGFDWSIPKSTKVRFHRKYKKSSKRINVAAIRSHLPSCSAANIMLVHLVGLSDAERPAAPFGKLGNLSQYFERANKEVIAFAIRNCRGAIQSKLIGALRRDCPSTVSQSDIATWFLEGGVDDRTDIDILCECLPLSAETHQNSTFSKVFALPKLSLRLLERSETFRSYFLKRISRGQCQEYIVHKKAFRVYGRLGAFGGEVIEVILKKLDKFLPAKTAAEIFQKTRNFAPAATVHVLRHRGIRPKQFVEMISTSEFRKLKKNSQLEIFDLKTPRGKPAFQQALRRIELAPEILEWLEKKPHFRKLLTRYRPTLLTSTKASTPQILAALVYAPADAALIQDTNLQLPETTSPTELLAALPTAISILGEKTRAAAALELAVRSEMRVFPNLLRLVQKLSPPYKVADLGRRFDDLYITYTLPKKSGGSRIISAPAPHLKMAQRGLLSLLYVEELSDAATGFRPGRSIKDNAALHVGKEIVVNADIQGFFPSTTYDQVYSLSRRVASGTLTPLGARLFSEICCHDGHLATGAPTSPAVSNLILKRLDDILSGIAKKLSVSYSRYADDITFSGDGAAVWMLKPLESHLSKLGYQLDPKKTNIFRKGRRQTVTGAVVNEKVGLARPLRKKLRAAVHHRLNGKQPSMHGRPLSDQALKGYLAYLHMLSPDHAKPLLIQLETLEEWQP